MNTSLPDPTDRSTRPDRSDRTGPATRRARVSTLAAVVGLVGFLALGWLGAQPAAAAERSGGCRAIGGSAAASGGPHRATVVVDPGTGPVWSACISFDGSISGLEALDLAAATIPGLAPVYEPYPGQGRAVCRLIGVGNDPPNCLSKSVEYWAYFRNGSYARGGGGASAVSDGDVEGWSFSRGQAPRPATQGTEAVAASAVAATTQPAPATSSPDVVTGSAPQPGAPSGSDGQPGSAPTSTPVDADPSATTAVEAAPGGAEVDGDDEQPDNTAPPGEPSADQSSAEMDADGDGGSSSAAASPGGGSISGPDAADSGSSLPSVLGFGAALASIGAIAIVVRRRHRPSTPIGGTEAAVTGQP